MPKGKDKKVVTFTVKAELADKLKEVAEAKGLTVPALVRMAITSAVGRMEAAAGDC